MAVTSQHDSHYVADSRALWGCSVDNYKITDILLFPPLWKKPGRLPPSCHLVYNQAEAQGLRKERKEPTSDGHLSFLFGQSFCIPVLCLGITRLPLENLEVSDALFGCCPCSWDADIGSWCQLHWSGGNLQTGWEAQWAEGVHDGAGQRFKQMGPAPAALRVQATARRRPWQHGGAEPSLHSDGQLADLSGIWWAT